VRSALAIPESATVIGTVCGLRAQKAVDVAIAAVAQVAERQRDVRFVIVGDGAERARLERLGAELLGDRVLFTGARPNSEIPDLVAAMDVLVCSSDFEGTPAAVLEWMRAGKPIVATAVGGIPGIIEDRTEGLLVPPRDRDALAAAIGTLVDQRQLRADLGAAARARQQRQFRFEHTLEQLEALYEELYWSSPQGRRELARR
jgi:glycosyltransferase involved in cell wall biosynthesis